MKNTDSPGIGCNLCLTNPCKSYTTPEETNIEPENGTQEDQLLGPKAESTMSQVTQHDLGLFVIWFEQKSHRFGKTTPVYNWRMYFLQVMLSSQNLQQVHI